MSDAIPLPQNTSWTSDYEQILEAIRVNSILISDIKKKRYLYLKHILQYFRIPVIIFSGINSVFSVGLQPYMEQGTISVINCMLSLITGIIGSIELYLSIQNTMEKELTMSKDFYMLSIEIYKVLSLEREHRGEDAKAFLEDKFGVYEKLVENSNINTKRILDKLAPLPLNGSNIPQSSSQMEIATNSSSNDNV